MLKDINPRKKAILKVSPDFSRSAIINFAEKLDFKSNEEITVYSKLIDDQNYTTPITKLAATGQEEYSNFLVQFSKPNDKYITAFVNEIIYKQGSKDYLREDMNGSIIFQLREGKILESFYTIAILEVI